MLKYITEASLITIQENIFIYIGQLPLLLLLKKHGKGEKPTMKCTLQATTFLLLESQTSRQATL